MTDTELRQWAFDQAVKSMPTGVTLDGLLWQAAKILEWVRPVQGGQGILPSGQSRQQTIDEMRAIASGTEKLAAQSGVGALYPTKTPNPGPLPAGRAPQEQAKPPKTSGL
jgi:hypothetical protein